METPVVLAQQPACLQRATELAARLGLSLAQVPPALGLALRVTPGGLELAALEAQSPAPLRMDFVEGRFGYRRRKGLGFREPLARALGLHRRGPVQVFDATPGLGRDSLLLALLGCRVEATERHPVVAELLADALDRARGVPALEQAVGRVQLRCGDARMALADGAPPDAVLLDPMFPDLGGSALVRKDLRLLRRLVGDDPDTDELLSAALGVARQRVVVRRHPGAPPLGSIPPHHSVSVRRTRFDVYLTG